jgi:hypothetical protein
VVVHRVVGIDPSQTHTGLVLVQDGNIVLAKTVSANYAAHILSEQQFDVAIIERPAEGPLGDKKTYAAYFLVCWVLDKVLSTKPTLKVHKVAPSEWKPIASAQQWDTPAMLQDAHQRDAYHLVLYWKHAFSRRTGR